MGSMPGSTSSSVPRTPKDEWITMHVPSFHLALARPAWPRPVLAATAPALERPRARTRCDRHTRGSQVANSSRLGICFESILIVKPTQDFAAVAAQPRPSIVAILITSTFRLPRVLEGGQRESGMGNLQPLYVVRRYLRPCLDGCAAAGRCSAAANCSRRITLRAPSVTSRT